MPLKIVLFTVVCLVFFTGILMAQPGKEGRYFTRGAQISFTSNSPLEKIEASTNSGNCVLDLGTGKLEAAVLINSFNFKKALMQEHFNENYMESSKYPKAVFKGEITNLSEVNFKKDGSYTVKAKGIMDMHGVKKEMTSEGTLTISGKELKIINSSFIIKCADYDIKIPSVVADKVAKEVKVKFSADLQLLAGK